jgi:Prp31 C terminal domain
MLTAGSGKVRITAQEKNLLKKQKIQERQQQQKFGGASGFATSGFSTSLAFTPVQGLELANPEAQAQAALRVKQANERYDVTKRRSKRGRVGRVGESGRVEEWGGRVEELW